MAGEMGKILADSKIKEPLTKRAVLFFMDTEFSSNCIVDKKQENK